MQLRRLTTPVAIGVAMVTLTALAASARGNPVQHVSLNDGGIWVTDNTLGQVSLGRFAKPIGELDGEVAPKSATSVDVWQNGPLVATFANGPAGGHLYAVDVDETDLADPAGTLVSPDAGGVALGGDPDDATLVVLGADHSLRRSVTTPGSGGSLNLDALALTAPVLAKKLPPNSAVAVGSDNTTWVAGGGKLFEWVAGATTPVVTSLPSVMQATDPMQVTTVGNVPVVADPTRRWLYLPDSGQQTVQLPSAVTPGGFELQQSSGTSAVVVAASSSALYLVNLTTGDLVTPRLSRPLAGPAAAPVQVGGCVEEAWASGEAGSYVQVCGAPPATVDVVSFSTGDASPQLVFRVNDDEVVLNDTANGGVFLVDQKVTNVTPKWQQGSSGAQSTIVVQTQGKQQNSQFRANPVTQGVRPGVTTEVHVLDAVKGDPRLTYAVSGVGSPDQPGVTVSVAPDAQTVLATVTSLAGDAHFQYTVDDGHGHSATGEVTLVPRTADENSPPYLKQGYQPPALSVASGGTLVVPVIGDWRDGDGDPLFIDSGSVSASAGAAAVTSGGALSLTAPHTAAGKTVTLSYGVSDGRVARPTMASLSVSVLGSSSAKFVAPVAEPDAAQAEAGTPITLQPLANDLPGVDPTNPNATLRLAAPVSLAPGTAAAGTKVSTDVADGTVTFTAQNAGDYFLDYTDAYGAAPTASSTIRVLVIPASGKPEPPVTIPDVAVLHGQQPAVVDVLADDSDPQGWLLGVTGATSGTPGVQVAVIDQEWLRISADDAQPGLTATVSYTVSDGKGSATGTVAVTAVAADPSADQITTTNTAITVRAGDSAAVPVLAGDASSTGLPLSLAGIPPAATPPITRLIASAQGANLRIDAPAAVKSEEETAVSYVATDADGTTAAGELDVTIMPAPSKADPDQAPVPQEVDARVAAGDTEVIQIPVSGVDPDGDSVTVTGVTVPPALGRIVAVGPDSISYQSYPGSLGTDTFTYQVTDPYGLTGTAQVQIAVLPAGPPQPPVAVDDVISAPPGASLHWNVLANDYIAPGDTVTVEPLSKTNTTRPPSVRLAGSYVYLQVPALPADPPVQFTYGATDGSTPSLAQVIVHAVTGAQIPPIANDAIAPLPSAGAKSVTVDVLKNDDDPVGSPSDLRVSWAGAGAAVDGANLTVKLACYPYAVPYQVTASDGLTATAVVYVQGTIPCANSATSSTIALKPGARITLPENGSVSVPLGSVLTDSAGRQLRITTTTGLTASPAGDLAVSANQESVFTVRALGGYSGPGAVTVQVYDGATMQDKNGTTATVTIPVQVGSDAPVLDCPVTPLPVVEGGAALSYDIGQLCHVSVSTQAPPRYTMSWTKAPGGVSASVVGGTSLQLSAASSAAPGSTGTLKITPAGGAGSTTAGTTAAGSTLSVEVVKAPLPTGSAASDSVKVGQSVTIDLRHYVTSPLPAPVISVLGVTTQAGSTATATVTHSGSIVTVTPDAGTSGTLNLTASVSDQPDRTDRAINVAITVTVIGVPGKPGTPTVTTSSGALLVFFAAADANGAPVEYYDVYANGAKHQCAASPCPVTGLTNGTPYTVDVRAINSAGTGPASATATAVPFGEPSQVTGLTATPGDGTVALTWQAPDGNGSPITGYSVEVSPPPAGQPQITTLGATTTDQVTGLTNGTTYTFTVQAINAADPGPWSLGVTTVPFGKPLTMAAPTAVGAAVPDPSAVLGITVSWPAVTGAADNGSPVTGYTVQEYQADSAAGPFGGTPVATRNVDPGTDAVPFTVNNDGSWYEFAVTATNAAGESTQSPLSTPAIQAAAPPDAPAGVTATATGQSNTIQFSFTAGAANAHAVTSIEYGINGATASGAITNGFTAGTAYTETLTNASNAAIANGSPVTVYVAECNDAGLCSPFSGPSAQVVPYQPIATPAVTATQDGESIAYTWSAQSDGLTETLQVCLAGACTNYTVPATGGYSGSATVGYGYSDTETITGHLTDTAGQSSGTATESAETVQAPPPPPAVSVGEGPSTTISGCTDSNCHAIDVSVSGFTANAAISYTCVLAGSSYGPYSRSGTGSPLTPGAAQSTNGSGGASFEADCVWGYWTSSAYSFQIHVTAGATSASASFTG
jgi:hypothetical protein